jgi:teichuronic acid biosynthesis glycosyltransferase TuaH
MNKKKILYIMHIDWRWIKQRPHFIAEGLSNFYDVTIVYFYSKRYLINNSDGLTKNERNMRILPAFRLPLYENRFIYDLNKIYMKFYFKLLIKIYDPDIIWITFPQLYDYIPQNIHCKIIYDCMDDATGFEFQDNFKSKILELEKKILKKASIVFVSSNYLFKELNDQYHCKDKMFLVRNAFGGNIIGNNVEKDKSETLKIGYIGTISQWIDFEKIEKSLENIENIEYHLIGPCELENNKLKHDRIKFYGTVPYNELYDYVKNFDCLIVPFIVDNKIKSADPGKLYGYINYN